MPKHSDSLFALVRDTVNLLIRDGFTVFYTGGAIGFDTVAARAVLSVKSEHPEISLTVVRPCENQDRFWTAEQKENYRSILQQADRVVCLSPGYYRGCMQVRNRYMVEHSDLCVVYGDREDGGTHHTISCARKKGIPVLNLNEALSFSDSAVL